MPVTVRMPQLGETVMEGTILRWAKQPGDAISEEEVLLEVSTDKVDTEVPSPAAGVVLEILVPAGETVPVGTPLAIIGEPGEQVATAPAATAAASAGEVAAPPAQPPTAVAPVAPPIPAPEPIPSPGPAPAPSPIPSPEPVPVPVPPPAPIPVPPAPAPAEGVGAPVGANGADLGFLSPVVRRLAAEHNVDLRQVQGTGLEGRVTRKDVQAFIDARAQAGAEAPAAAPVPAAAPAPAMPVVEIIPAAPALVPQPAVPEPAPTAPSLALTEEEEEGAAYEEEAAEVAGPRRVGLGRGISALIPGAEAAPMTPPRPAAPPAPPSPAPKPPTAVPLRAGDRAEDPTRLRLRIAEHMVHNRRTAAHVWTVAEVDFEAVERHRQGAKAAFREKEGFSLTYLPYIARATVDALNAFPAVNSSFYTDEKKQVFHGAVNLGIAVDLDQRGLIVMNIPGADGLRMRELARRIRAVAEKARRGDLVPDDAAGSTFTITNPGPYGSMMSSPIINVPEVAILSTDTVVKRPVVITDGLGADAIAIHHIGYLGLTWDHRAFDGVTAVLFLRRIKEILETRDWDPELA